MRIVIVEGDEDTRSILARSMRRADAEVSVADTATLGLELVADREPELVLVDLDLADLDSVVLARYAEHAHSRGGYVIGITAFADGDGEDHGCDERWVEPIDTGRLRRLIDQLKRR